jgi:flagellar biogenesis protein FliO
MNAPAADLPGLGGSIALSLVSLGVVCLVAWGLLRWLSRRGIGGTPLGGPIKVIARCPLEPRRSLYIVEAAGRHLLIGVGEGAPSALAELDAEAVRAAVAADGRRPGFAEILRGTAASWRGSVGPGKAGSGEGG